MALEYRLVLCPGPTPETAAALAAPTLVASAERDGLLTVDARVSLDMSLAIRRGTDGYFEADGDAGRWDWEPHTYLSINFRMGDRHLETGVYRMLEAVARVLGGTLDDAALVFNSDELLLTRVGGAFRKHNRSQWWDHYAGLNEIIQG